MFAQPSPSSQPTRNPAKPAPPNPSESPNWLLKLGQTIFVGIGVIGFFLLIQSK
jgi:hypothetical protein